VRPHPGGDQAANPFSELLDDREPADIATAEPAATAEAVAPAENASVEAAPPQDHPSIVVKAATDEGEIAKLPAELMLVIAMAGQQAAPKEEAAKPAAGVYRPLGRAQFMDKV
jgi:hypothetical protein